MKTAIIQPFFCAYLCYYQIINAVDTFVIYDNIKKTKSGWFNKNKILMNGKDRLFTIPVKKDHDYLNINERYLAENAEKEKKKILAQIYNSYLKAPHFEEIYPFVEDIFLQKNENLFDFIYYSVLRYAELLDIKTRIIISSSLPVDHELKSQDKVIAICKYLDTDIYINSISGKFLYDKKEFENSNIELKFIKSKYISYPQFDNTFVPWLSIIDVLMFNGVEKTKELLQEYELL